MRNYLVLFELEYYPRPPGARIFGPQAVNFVAVDKAGARKAAEGAAVALAEATGTKPYWSIKSITAVGESFA